MALFDRIKLKKLTIKAYKDAKRQVQVEEPFEAMFNPSSFSQKYEIEYSKQQGLNSTDKPQNYVRSAPRELKLKLVLDGTGVQEMGIVTLGKQQSVSERVKEFLKLTYEMNGDIHEPNYLVVEWGGKDPIFSCRLGSMEVMYTSFNRDGAPLRAELDVTLISDQDVARRIAVENKHSPDLTHARIVKSGDTLSLLTKEVYGSSRYYLRVAQANNLDDFRNLTPGQVIFFPPLAK